MDSNGKFLNPRIFKRGETVIKYDCPTLDTLRDQINQINTSLKQILIDVGINDLEKCGEETFRKKYEEIIEALVQKVKNTKVYISALLLLGDEHNYKIHIENKMLDSLCNKYNIGFIHDPQINRSHLYDNKHLSRQQGFPIFLRSIRETLFDLPPRRSPGQRYRNGFSYPYPFLWPQSPIFSYVNSRNLGGRY